MRTKSPCYNGGKGCPRRAVGCRAGCDAWKEWQAAHEAEKSRIDRQKGRDADVERFMAGKWKRTHDANREASRKLGGRR